MMKIKFGLNFIALAILVSVGAASQTLAQSGATRPRRVTPSQPTPTPAATGASTPSTPTRTASTAQASGAQGSTAHAFSLYQQKQYEAALREAKQIAAADAKNSEAWKIAGFAEIELKQYAEAAADLQRALDLQRAAGEEDAPTADALSEAYMRTEQYERALPLLVAATARKGATPDARLLYSRGLAEFNTDKRADAERSFNAAVKADPKNTGALFYLGRLAFDRKDYTTTINMLNRATLNDPRLAQGWTLLAHSYLRRAQAATAGPKADADYLAAVRAAESLVKLRNDEDSALLLAQALIYSKQYARAATALEPAAAKDGAQGTTLYLLGFSHSRAKNYPKAIAALERASAKTPDNVEVFRELGFALEASKQYAKALAAYERGLQLAPADEYFKESAERVRPFAK
ncbi:MAG TPA: tetratricopeptide repeat protein [Pyrinomonadaceae bacterium]|nr:tetratricopeptide repeat protein [Pyrinomonadaceae bacterium]